MKLADLDKWYGDNELVYDDIFRMSGKSWGNMTYEKKLEFYNAENKPRKYYNNPKLSLTEKLNFEKSLDGKYRTLFEWPLIREYMRTFLFHYAQKCWRIRHLEREIGSCKDSNHRLVEHNYFLMKNKEELESIIEFLKKNHVDEADIVRLA